MENIYKRIQGETSKNYYTVNYRYDMNNLNEYNKIHIFLGVVHSHRYDIESGYNPKHGYIYDVLLTDENDEALAICQIHPLEGNMVICQRGEKIFDYFVTTFKSAYKDELVKEKNKKY